MKNLQLLVLVLFLFLLAPDVRPQSVAVRDSLSKKLKTLPNDTNRVITLNALGFEYYLNQPDTTYLLGQQAYELALSLKYPLGEARALNVMAVAFMQLGDDAKALKMFTQSKEFYIKLKNTRGIAIALSNIADMHMQQGEWQKALEKMRECYAIFKTIPNPDLSNKPVFLSNIGECFYNLNQLDSAIVYLNQALTVAKEHNESMLTTILYLLGDVALAKNNTVLAFSYYRQSISVSIKVESYNDLYQGYYRIAKLYQNSGQRDSTLYYAKLALNFAQKVSYSRGILKSSQNLASLYEGNNDAEALRYYKISVAAKDSLFSQDRVKQLLSLTFEEKQKAQQIEAARVEYKNTIRLYILIGILAVFGLLALLLFRNNRQKQKANNLLRRQKEEINLQRDKAEKALSQLKSTQAQLIQSEKMASLGELTAGIAHEIQNPLNFVNNFSEVNTELIEEMKSELKAGKSEDAISIANDIAENEQKINHHGKRADAIVKGMLQHSQSNSGLKEPTDINAMADEYLRLAYHGLRAKDKLFNATLKTDFDETIGNINIIPQDISRVILNLITNAFYAVTEKKNQQTNGYEPTVSVSTSRSLSPGESWGEVLISVKDNGNGIPQKVLDKIFQPFFTTKPAGQGTGLGLSLAYDIVKAHGGELKVETKDGEGTVFIIQLINNSIL